MFYLSLCSFPILCAHDGLWLVIDNFLGFVIVTSGVVWAIRKYTPYAYFFPGTCAYYDL